MFYFNAVDWCRWHAHIVVLTSIQALYSDFYLNIVWNAYINTNLNLGKFAAWLCGLHVVTILFWRFVLGLITNWAPYSMHRHWGLMKIWSKMCITVAWKQDYIFRGFDLVTCKYQLLWVFCYFCITKKLTTKLALLHWGSMGFFLSFPQFVVEGIPYYCVNIDSDYVQFITKVSTPLTFL